MMTKFESVWDAIEDTPEQAAKMRLRSALMRQVSDVVNGWDVPQVKAAKRLNITQPRLNDLIRGKIHKFSLDALVEIAESAHLHVELSVTNEGEVA
ncbi:helix-turn-helix domain-containing protein [Halomonas llamarensis]|uniref:XRE family transcriptional regulator n=1 Tax=Halomonas llamarensis TaxID=2945104 RepID=A0ABT0SM96_9GAMM|nr:XRE family transcriptional regulator [Halomonas llamarensis]MCL7928595.1 XRE family transcriptional regulator [Halomonas llamarensis]